MKQAAIDHATNLEDLERLDAGAREVEVGLSRELERLDALAKALTRVAELHRHHLRSNVLALRDDDEPRRSVPIAASDVVIPRPAPVAERATEIDVTSTEPRTQRFTDRAIAAHVAREAVATQLAVVRRLRDAIGARRNALRTSP